MDANDLRMLDRPLRAVGERVAPPLDDAPAASAGAVFRAATTPAPEWFREAPPPRRWLLEQSVDDSAELRGWLPRGKVGLLVGEGGAGKTMALVQLAIAVATGRDWFGLHVASPGSVLLALAEEDADEVRWRLHAAAKRARLTDDEITVAAARILIVPLAGTSVAVLERDRSGRSEETDALADLRRLLETRSDWRLVALDPLARWAGVDAETDNAQATRFIESVETLAAGPGSPTVLLSHHTSKAARRIGERRATSARGASGLVDAVRWCATMVVDSRGAATIHLAVVKSNYSHLGAPLLLTRNDDGTLSRLEHAATGRREAERAVGGTPSVEHRILQQVAVQQFTTKAAIRKAVGGSMASVQQALANLIRSGQIAREHRSAAYRVVEPTNSSPKETVSLVRIGPRD